jgi:hypothetical protein
MPRWSTDPSSQISLDDARNLIGRSAAGATRRFPLRSPAALGLTRSRLAGRSAKIFRRRPGLVALASFGVWLALPNGNVAGIVFLVVAVAFGRHWFEGMRKRRRS